MICDAGLIFPQVPITCPTLTAHHAFVGQLYTRTGCTLGIKELNLQQTMIVLSGLQVEGDLQFLRSRYLPLYTGIIERVAVLQCQPTAVQAYGGHDRAVNIPASKHRQPISSGCSPVGLCELLPIRMTVCFRHHRHRNMRYPHVLLIHRIGHPEVAVVRYAITLLNASHVLRPVALVVAAIAHGWNFSLHEVERGVFVAVLAQRNGQWPAVLRRIIDCSVGTVSEALSPNLRITVHETSGSFYGLCPRQTAISTRRGQRMFP